MGNYEMQIGKYRLLKVLNKGRYVDVWLGEHVRLRKKFAIKILIPEAIPNCNDRHRARRRFYKEASIQAGLDHPYIVQVFDYGEDQGLPFFVMEYAPFGSLARRHRPGVRLTLPTVRTYTSQMGRAIHYVHTRGLVHRDIKPQNMFLKTRGMILLGDFGLVTPDQGKFYSRMILEFGGTRAYMAPEQAQGEPCPASDQYAYATVVFEWLTGRRPYCGTAEQITWQRKHLPPPSMRAIVPEIPVGVERVVLTALQQTPGHRFNTMLDFTLAFEDACKPVLVRLPYDASTGRSHRMVISHRYEPASRYSAVLQR